MRLFEDRVPVEHERPAGAKIAGALDLGPDDERQDDDVRDARSDPRPQAIEAKERREGERHPAVKPHGGGASRKHTHEHGPSDLLGRGAFALRQDPDAANARDEALEHDGKLIILPILGQHEGDGSQ